MASPKSLALAYAVSRKMKSGGASAPSAPSSKMPSMLGQMMKNRMARGGMVEDQDEDFLSDEMEPNEIEFGVETYPDPDNTEHPIIEDEDPATRRKKMISSIMMKNRG